jgi:hypothetical protein
VNDDPFRPPSSNVEVRRYRRGSAVKALLLGLAVDMGGTFMAGFIATVAIAAFVGGTGGELDDFENVVGGFSYDSGPGLVLMAIGCFFSVLGAYVCSRSARHSEHRLGAILAAISVLFGVLVDPQPAVMTTLLSALTVASVMTGTHLGVRANRRDAALATASR